MRYFLFLIISFFSFTLQAAELPFTPRVVNYSVHDYRAGNQNWAVTVDSSGIVYVGNTKGLLEFDGARWNLYTLPSGGMVRAVYASGDGKIFVGSYEEFGFFVRDEYNRLVYHSLKDLISGFDFNNDEIWNIVAIENKLYFQSFSSYFVYDGEKIAGIRTNELPLNFIKQDQTVFTQLINEDLSLFDGIGTRSVISRAMLGNDDVVAALPLDGQLLFVTRNSGIFRYDGKSVIPWKTEADKSLNIFSVNKAVMTLDSLYVLGTLSDGIYAIDKKGKLRWKINADSKLPNNTVLGLFCDSRNNIWVALDNGIAFIENNSDMYLFEPSTRKMGMVYDVAAGEKETFIASNHGLYRYADKLELIPGSEEQAWTVSDIDGQLICGHNKGTFAVRDGKFSLLSDVRGALCMRKAVFHNEEILLQGTYTYLSIFKKDASGVWYFSNAVDGFLQPVRNLETDHLGNIWAEHLHKGLFRVRLDKELKKTTEVEYYERLGDTERDLISVFKIAGRVVFADGENFYTYNDLNDSIVRYNLLNDELSALKDTYKVVPVSDDSWWFVSDNKYALVDLRDGHFVISRQIPVSMFDNPPVDRQGNIEVDRKNGDAYICLNGAIARITSRKEQQKDVSPELWIAEVLIWDDRENEDFVRLPVNGSVGIDNNYNNILIRLASPLRAEKDGYIRYKLEGFSSDWTIDMPGMEKVYTRLPYGHYNFRAELYDDNRLLLASVAYPFVVERPWFLSYLAFIIYAILFAGLLVLAYIILQKRKNKLIRKQLLEHAVELDRQQQRIVELENERLGAELAFKSKELSGLAMLDIANKEFLAELKAELQKQRIEGQFSKKFFDRMIRLIDGNVNSDESWQMFQSNFDRIHENFFRNLKLHYPDLTPNDLRLCAFLRLNMPTKDIAKLMNISLRGVEAARYRLRKRLNIPMEESLVDFMIGFK